MPTGLRRFQQTRQRHFVTFSCYRRQPKLGTAVPRDAFEQSLEAARRTYHFCVAGYVVMPEHVPLRVTEPPRILLAQFLKAVKQICSRKLRGRREKFRQDRYCDSNVQGEKAGSEVLR